MGLLAVSSGMFLLIQEAYSIERGFNGHKCVFGDCKYFGRVYTGKNSLEVSLEKIWAYESTKDEFLKEVLHFFRHYYDDDDIRRKDVEYAEYQTQQLRKYIAALKEKSQN